MTIGTDVPSTEIASVWRFKRRRYFSKRAAYTAWARCIMREEHEDLAEGEGWCTCAFCHDRRFSNSEVLAIITTRLMADETVTAGDVWDLVQAHNG